MDTCCITDLQLPFMLSKDCVLCAPPRPWRGEANKTHVVSEFLEPSGGREDEELKRGGRVTWGEVGKLGRARLYGLQSQEEEMLL